MIAVQAPSTLTPQLSKRARRCGPMVLGSGGAHAERCVRKESGVLWNCLTIVATARPGRSLALRAAQKGHHLWPE